MITEIINLKHKMSKQIRRYKQALLRLFIIVATDEGPSSKLALSKGGSRGNIES